MPVRSLVLASAAFLASLPAAAQSAAPTGCWQARSHLYGSYAMAFCLRSGGAGLYRVRGDGYDCQGRGTWRIGSGGRRMVYQMQRGSCGPTANWTADRFECDLGASAGGAIACTYHPNAPGYGVTRFAAGRQP